MMRLDSSLGAAATRLMALSWKAFPDTDGVQVCPCGCRREYVVAPAMQTGLTEPVCPWQPHFLIKDGVVWSVLYSRLWPLLCFGG